MTNVNIAVRVVQASPLPRNIRANAEYADAVISSGGVDLVLMPELFLTGYQTERLDELALSVDDAVVSALALRCKDNGVALVVGFIERSEHGGFYNSLLAIDRDGEVRESIRKTHLFGRERDVFEAGDELSPIQLCGVRWGTMNCFELEFPEVARTLALRGAEGFLCASANMHPYGEEHALAVRARSMENRLPLAYANRVGNEDGHRFCGRSLVVDHDGEVVQELTDDSERSAVACIEVGRQPARDVDMIAQRRPELYACCGNERP